MRLEPWPTPGVQTWGSGEVPDLVRRHADLGAVRRGRVRDDLGRGALADLQRDTRVPGAVLDLHDPVPPALVGGGEGADLAAVDPHGDRAGDLLHGIGVLG